MNTLTVSLIKMIASHSTGHSVPLHRRAGKEIEGRTVVRIECPMRHLPRYDLGAPVTLLDVVIYYR